MRKANLLFLLKRLGVRTRRWSRREANEPKPGDANSEYEEGGIYVFWSIQSAITTHHRPDG